MPFEAHPEIHRKGYLQYRACVKSNDRRSIPSCSLDAFLRQRPTNTNPSTLGVDDQGPNDGPSLVKIGCLPLVRWYVSDCTYDVCSNLGYHNLPILCEVRHFSIKSRKRRPIGIVIAELLERGDREPIDFLRVSLAEFSKYR